MNFLFIGGQCANDMCSCTAHASKYVILKASDLLPFPETQAGSHYGNYYQHGHQNDDSHNYWCHDNSYTHFCIGWIYKAENYR